MLTQRTQRKQAGWRVSPIIILRVRQAAKNERISANDFVERVLSEATKRIESEEEKKERLASNDSFLERFAGTWTGAAFPEGSSEPNKTNSKKIVAL